MLKTVSMQRYHVQPLLVNDLDSQCAAHFLNWFSQQPHSVIQAVIEIGIHGAGGWIDQVDAWFDLCEGGSGSGEGEDCHWDSERLGPWVYEHLAVADVAYSLTRHVRGWGVETIAAYGRLAKKEVAHDDDAPS